MTVSLLKPLVASVALGAVLFAGVNAFAVTPWQLRIPSIMCNNVVAGPPPQALASNGAFANCPFPNGTDKLSSTVNQVVVDLTNPFSADHVAKAALCRFSSWATLCDMTLTQGTIPAMGHGSLVISDAFTWSGDSNFGYDYVEVTGPSVNLAGIYITGNNP